MFYNNVQDKISIFVLYLTCFGWIVLKLRVFYNDTLWIKNNKCYLWRYIIFVPSILKIQKFILKLF